MPKKQPPPVLSVSELRTKLTLLLSGSKDPVEAVEWLLARFNGWDLEAMILELRQEQRNKEHT